MIRLARLSIRWPVQALILWAFVAFVLRDRPGHKPQALTLDHRGAGL